MSANGVSSALSPAARSAEGSLSGANGVSAAASPAARGAEDSPSGASGYRGRFAPSPTGDLHAGSLAAALASWLDARAQGGAWLLRIEDIDPPREVAGAATRIVEALARFGMTSDEPVLRQADRSAQYQAALGQLDAAGLLYGCTCSRRTIAAAQRRLVLSPDIYPGTCRQGAAGKGPQALRVRAPDEVVGFVDRGCGRFEQNLARDVGDFVVRRADGLWAYQLAVVVDDAAQHITDVVRGADLLDNTPRHIWLQRALGLPTPRYLHVPVVTNDRGEKLSKQTGAQALDAARPLAELERAWQHLGFSAIGAISVPAFLDLATVLWRQRWSA